MHFGTLLGKIRDIKNMKIEEKMIIIKKILKALQLISINSIHYLTPIIQNLVAKSHVPWSNAPKQLFRSIPALRKLLDC